MRNSLPNRVWNDSDREVRMRRFYTQFSFWVLLHFYHFAFAEQDDRASQQPPKAGWEDGPRRRGTLGLLYQCLSTIFVCTWTVLHLNVPAVTDSGWARSLRQAKWMMINILFPEFLFAKAICDLRLALRHLFRLAEVAQQRPDALSWKSVTDGRLVRRWEWTVEHGSWMQRFLYRLLVLGQFSAKAVHFGPPEPVVDTLSNDIDLEVAVEDESADFLGRRVWTLTHSYYVNMGGIQAPAIVSLSRETRRRLDWESQLQRLRVVRGDDLLVTVDPNEVEDWSKASHPLKQLQLSHEDIDDKSKSDWVAKTIAILQITWLVLDVTTRRSTGLPVTQLEIATLSFSVLALCTYVVNWKRPRDIMHPTLLQMPVFNVGKQFQGHQVQSFSSSLWYPSSENPALERPKQDRVPNDFVWMEGDLPLIWNLLALSSLLFGGLHCIAWSFEFPSRIEQVAWRAGSVASGVLPAVSLAVALPLRFISRSYNDRKCASAILSSIRMVQQFSAAWWALIEAKPTALRWESEAWDVFLSLEPSGSRDWNRKPLATGNKSFSAQARASIRWKRAQFETIWKGVCDFRHQCLASTERHGKLWLLLGDREKHETLLTYADKLRVEVSGWLKKGEDDGSELWNSYEQHITDSLAPNERARLPKACCREYIISKLGEIEEHVSRARRLRTVCDQATRFVSIVCGGLYIAARLIMIIITFSSLRSVPAGVYQSVNWTRFLPTLS